MFSLRSLMSLITWNTSFEANPESSDSPSYGDDEIRNLKTAMRERFEKGHTMNTAVGTVGPDGWHKSGSAKLYYQAAEPTTRPDGTTALTADDNGRRWVRSTDKREYVYVHPSWTAVTTLSGANNTFSGSNIFGGTTYFSGSAVFYDTATFSSPVVFNDDVEVATDLEVGGSTTVGDVTISSSSSSVFKIATSNLNLTALYFASGTTEEDVFDAIVAEVGSGNLNYAILGRYQYELVRMAKVGDDITFMDNSDNIDLRIDEDSADTLSYDLKILVLY